MRATLVVLLATGCVTQHRITISGAALVEHRAELQTHGQATIDASDQRDDDGAWHTRETVRLDQPLRLDGETRTVRELVTDVSLDSFPIEVRRYATLDLGRTLGATARILVAGAIVAAVTCGLACADGSTAKDASEVTLIVAGGVIVVGLGWLIISCLHSGCHD